MDRDAWRRVDDVLQRAMALDPGRLGAFLDEACGVDRELRREVESLLEYDRRAAGFLETPVTPCAMPRTAMPRRLGAYTLLRPIAFGGMGRVYLAARSDHEYEQCVAVKLVAHASRAAFLSERLRRERQILADLDHPNIARLLDGGTADDGSPYLVMEYIEGVPVNRYCEQEELSVDDVLRLFREICATVQYAHQHLVVHRDLKPGNILVTRDGVPKLLDFGIAKLLEPGRAAARTTAAGFRPMTLHYASPEQIRGGAVSTTSDVYSLGVVLYELLTGVGPYRLSGDLPHEVERAVLEQEPPRPSDVARDDRRRRLRGDLDDIVLTAMRKDPARRYASVERLSEDLRRHLERLPVVARPPTLGYRATRFARRHRWMLAVAAAFVLLGAAFVVTLAAQVERTVAERDKAEEALDFLVGVFQMPETEEPWAEEVTARQILESGVERIRRKLADRPHLRATLISAMGEAYMSLDLFDEAVTLLREALELRRATLGEAHPDVAASLHDLGVLHHRRFELEAAEVFLREALARRQARFGDRHAVVAESLAALARVLESREAFEEADALYRRALDLLGGLLGPSHPEVAIARASWAVSRARRADPRETESILTDCVSALRSTLGEDHVEVGLALANLGAVQADLGRARESIETHREALAILRRTFEADHPEVTATLNNLALLYFDLGELEGSAEIHLQLLEQRRRLLGDTHPKVAVSANNLAVARLEQGELATAEELYREALEIRRVVFGDEHHMVAISRANLAEVLRRQGELDAAEELFQLSLEGLRRSLGDDHVRLSQPLSGIADVLMDRGRLEAAEPLLREALAMRRRHFPAGHPRITQAEERLNELQRRRDGSMPAP